jgi:O-antigen/teichoic acid export membrane protein
VKFTSYKRWIALISVFLAGQGSVQILNLISGLLLLRWLSVEAYAQYSVAFGFQSTLGMLVELGFSGSILALVGDRGSDKKVVGTYIRSVKHFRNRLLAVMIPLAAVAFPLVTSKQNWDSTTQLLLFVSIVSSLFFQGWVSYYSPPLLINQQIRQLYQPQVISAIGRIILCFILYLTSTLTSWTTAWVSSAVIAVNGLLYRTATKHSIIEPRNSDPQVNREMLRYLAPFIPVITFTAFQGQVSLALITIFGQTKSIAEVAALGRIGQLFLILGACNRVIVAPYIAKVANQNLAKKYFQILGVAVTIAVILSLIAFLFPQSLLWILGSKYQNLKTEVALVVTATSFSYVANVLETMNSSRKWVYWWGSSCEIALIIIIQVICISVMNLSRTIEVIYFSLIVSIAYFVVHFVIGGYGLIQNNSLKFGD